MTKRRWIFATMAVLAVTSGGFALAQEGAVGEAVQAPASEGDVAVRREANMTGAEQLAEAENVVQHGTQLSRREQAMLDEARRERDISRVTCLNDKLTQTNANLRTVNTRVENLSEAVQAQDTSRRNHEFTVIMVLGQKFSTLEQEANQCIGNDLYETGSTAVVTTVDPNVPDETDSMRLSPAGTATQGPDPSLPPPPMSPTI
ncbi:MAG: hypothetical protein JRH11_04870 [Deltaproteobacteria bacterium]|nr:hypothetical protein [Deltaproteobacteria bacterium]